jgi:hypothetical protein
MTKYEYVKQEIECLNESDLMELYNEFAMDTHYELVYRNDQETIIEYFNNNLRKYFEEFVNNSKYRIKDHYFIFDGYGHVKSFNFLDCGLDLDAVVNWIDDNDLYDKYEHLFGYYEDCEEEEEE